MVSVDLFFSLKHFAHRSLWCDGSPVWSPLHELDRYLEKASLGKIEVEIPKTVTLINPEKISIGKGTVIEPGAMIQGPCIIGKECAIRHGAYLRGGVLCGDGCTVGHSAEIKRSILLNFANVTHFVYAGDSIIGSGANLGAGVKCANLRLDRREVCISFEGKKMRTGLTKMGAIIGDGVQIGCNSVLNPGTLMGRESVCYPLVNFSGYAPPKSKIKGQSNWTLETADPTLLLEQIGP